MTTTDRLTGISTTTTAQPSTGGARQAQAPTASVRAPAARRAATGGPSSALPVAEEGGNIPSAGVIVRADAPADGPRTYTIALPAGLELLSLNDRFHWRERNRRSQVIKQAAATLALHAKIPALERARIAVEYQPPDRRHRDADNPIASAKAAIDGLVAAGCLLDDECPRYVTGVYCTIGEIFGPRGRLVLYVTEVTS